MRLNWVRLFNFRGIEKREVSFSVNGVTIVEGHNEVGKTSITEALRLVIDLPDSSRKSQVKSVKPVGRDVGPEVELSFSSGDYELVYRKRWLRQAETTLEIRSPRPDALTGREAHDRVKEILAETLDEDLWKALRIDQGRELTLPLFDMPSMARALDRAAGGDLATEREDTLWERIGEEYEEYWTPTGQPKNALKSLGNRLELVRGEVSKLGKQLADIESDAAQVSRLVAEHSRLALTQTESKRQETELADQWESTQELLRNVERLSAVHEAAVAERDRVVDEQHRRRDLIDTLKSRDMALAGLVAEAELAAPVLAAATRNITKAKADFAAALSDLRSAEDKQRLANADRDYLRWQIELEQLKERYERYVKAAEILRETEIFLETAKVDDDLVERLEHAYLEHERARAASDSAAVSVGAVALSDITLNVDGEEFKLASGDVHSVLVDDELSIEVPDIVRISVRAGPESRELADERISTLREFQSLCELGGVSDLAGARASAQERRDAVRNRQEASNSIKRDLRDLTPEVLHDKIRGLSKRVASYPKERPQDSPLPSDFEEAKRFAYEMERSVAGRKTQYGTCEEAVKAASDALHEAQLGERVLSARIGDARASREAAAAGLAAAREKKKDEEVTAAIAVAQQGVDKAQGLLEQAQMTLNSADPHSLKARLENARQATIRATAELHSNMEAQSRLRVKLEIRGEEGLHTRHEEAIFELEHVEREYRRTMGRAEAASLLRATFGKHRRIARQRYVGPFKERIDQLGRIVFGATFSVELDDDLRIARRTLDGITLNVDQLSTGAREQLGVLSRLACAAIVSPDDGGAPLIIDDALGWSDPQRLQNMGAAIAAAARQCQVIVLTCTPGRYANVGGARVISLDA